MKAGSSAIVIHDVVINNQVVFTKGDAVLVEAISPHPERPAYMYVVTSPQLGTKYLLCDADLVMVATPQAQPQQPPSRPPIPPTPVGPAVGSMKMGTPTPSAVRKKVPVQPVGAKAKPGGSADNKRSALAGCGVAVLVLIAIIVVVAVIASSSGKKENTPVTSSAQTSTTPAAAPPVQKTWQTVATFNGNANRRSESFTLTGGEQKLSYNVTGGDMVLCAIYVVPKGTSLESEGGFAEVDLDQAGPGDTQLVKDPGEYYLDVSSANCQWTVTIQELR